MPRPAFNFSFLALSQVKNFTDQVYESVCLLGTRQAQPNCAPFCACGSPKDRPHVVGAVGVTRFDRQGAFSTRTRSDFERGTSEQTQLTPGAGSIAAGVHVVRLRGLTIVAVMQAADLRRDDDLAGRGTRRPAVRGVFAQAEMRAAPMVVGEIRAKHAAEMPVVEVQPPYS
jgi:hypothetical protein